MCYFLAFFLSGFLEKVIRMDRLIEVYAIV